MQNFEKDAQLAARAQAGDSAATEILLNRYKSMVSARARRFFLADGETEDLVQEGMIALHYAIGKYKPAEGKSFKNFAYLCVTSRIISALRAADKRLEGDAALFELVEEGTPEDYLIDGEERAEFDGMLMKELTDFEYRVMKLYLEGRRYTEIAEATGKDKKSIDNALARSKKKLQQAYTKKQLP